MTQLITTSSVKVVGERKSAFSLEKEDNNKKLSSWVPDLAELSFRNMNVTTLQHQNDIHPDFQKGRNTIWQQSSPFYTRLNFDFQET